MKTSVIIVTLLAAVSLSYAVDRESLIKAAIQEVKAEHAAATVQTNTGEGAVTASNLLLAFKRPSVEAIDQGSKRAMFEKMLNKAERSILETEREETESQSKFAEAEGIAKVLIHKPGSVLTQEEVAHIYQESGECTDPDEPVDCPANSETVRTIDGRCNNVDHPRFGSAGSPFRRLIDAQYEDGLSQLRGTMQSERSHLVNEGPFSPPNPSARIVTTNVVSDRSIDNTNMTHLLMQWGQFIDHDLDLAPPFNVTCNGCSMTEKCVPIRVPTGDPTFSSCHPFPRSMPFCDHRVKNGRVLPREQRNELTAFLDGSQIYGSTDRVYRAVRDGDTPFLKTGRRIPDNGGLSLPLADSKEHLVECMPGNRTDCFLAGDVRVNEHPALIIMHTIWMREHNRIAAALKQINPSLNNETVFQTAKAIVGAEIQKITLKDYLPILIGDLLPEYTEYKPEVNPSIPNAFATAAFRFGHSQIDPFFARLDSNNQPLDIGPLSLLDSFFDPSQYETSGGTDPILRGLLMKPAKSVDEFVTDVLTNHLFETHGTSMDLAALNIQRGRDHGLPPYLTWKRWAAKECGISSDIENDLTLVRLLQTYGTLETVDLWVGGLAERNVQGGILGATFACIFNKTFEAIRDGDRFYYEKKNETSVFTPYQIKQIEKASLSRVICDNTNITQVQRNAFRGDQEQVDCSSIEGIDLSAWNSDSRRCYMRVEVHSQTSSSEVDVVTREENSPNIGHRKRLENGETTACVQMRCPTGDVLEKLEVTVRNKICTEQSNLNRNTNGKYEVKVGDLWESSTGVYLGEEACNQGRVSGVTFACNSSKVAIEESVGALLKDLEDELFEVTNEQSSENVLQEQNSSQWKAKTINVLEGLLESLKGEEQATSEENEATDQELLGNLTKLLKSMRK